MKRVEKGFRYFREINTVYYDPAVISVEEMEAALKKAGTYLGTINSQKTSMFSMSEKGAK